MARKPKSNLSKDEQRLKDIEDAVRAVRENPNSYDNIWRLFREGHLAFRQGLGLPVCAVEDTIRKALDLPISDDVS